MSKKKRSIRELHDDPREVFIEFLDQVFKHNWDEDVSFEAWKIHCSNTDRVERWLVAFYKILKSPPPDFESLWRRHGHMGFMHDSDLPTERDYTEEEVLAWAKATYLKFANYLFENAKLSVGEYLSL